jgi:hypothetical protein
MRARPGAAVAAAFLVFAIGAPTAAPSRPPPTRTISFSGYTWTVKSSSGKVGPGPNYFSSSADNVQVDSVDRLHLRVTYVNGRWYCAEVVNTQSLGYGTYSFTLDSPVDALDPSVTLGLFTWSDRPQYAHRELDIEFARWGNAADPTNGQYVVQPYDSPGHLTRITQSGAATSTQSFTWSRSSVAFSSPSATPSSWVFSGSGVPLAGGEHAHMNLWLFQGQAPTDGQEVEVVVKAFSFTPLS